MQFYLFLNVLEQYVSGNNDVYGDKLNFVVTMIFTIVSALLMNSFNYLRALSSTDCLSNSDEIPEMVNPSIIQIEYCKTADSSCSSIVIPLTVSHGMEIPVKQLLKSLFPVSVHFFCYAAEECVFANNGNIRRLKVNVL